MRRLMATLHRRLGPADAGMSLVEVIVAMMIFAILSVCIAQSTIVALTTTRDAQSREVATNLAASEIDAVRQLADPRLIESTSGVTTVVDGVTFTTRRDVAWVNSAGSASGCTGTSQLSYLTVNVSVGWKSQLQGTRSATADTIIAPGSRINDAQTGTVLVSVLGVNGVAMPGISVSLVSGSSTVSLGSTDSAGCAFGFRVAPGTYSVRLSKTGWVSSRQETSPESPVIVEAAKAASVAFQYDRANEYEVQLVVPTSLTHVRPSNPATTFTNASGTWYFDRGIGTTPLHPYPQGYSVIHGPYAPALAGDDGGTPSSGCVSPDPGAWPEGTSFGVPVAAGVRANPIAPTSGNRVIAVVRAGAVIAQNRANQELRAVPAVAPVAAGDPGCSTSRTFTFPTFNNNAVALILPFGTWRIERKVGSAWTDITGQLIADTNPTLPVPMPAGSTTITLDPRSVR